MQLFVMKPSQPTPRRAGPLVLCLCLALMGGNAHAQMWLVTPDEARASMAAPVMPEPKTLVHPDAPRIELMAPDVKSPVGSPTRIQLRFRSSAPATVRPETFKVRYGAFRIDITERLSGVAKVTAEGIDVSEARLPKGSHKLNIEVQDSAQRVGQRTIEFTVE